jgi:N-acetylneuraminate 9-O-acetyltransferase
MYNWTGASVELRAYQLQRLLVATCLFLWAYQQTDWLSRHGHYRYSLGDFVGHFVNLNLLPLTLSYALGTNLLFYRFQPIMSFWMVVVFITLRISDSWNENPFLVLFKILISWDLISLLFWQPGLVRVAFSLLRFTCNVKWHPDEWRTAIMDELNVVYIGMFAAIARIWIERAIKSPLAKESPPTPYVARVCLLMPNEYAFTNMTPSPKFS